MNTRNVNRQEYPLARPMHNVKKGGYEDYPAWQRLTKRKFAMTEPSLEGNKFQFFLKKSFFSNFFTWKNFPKRKFVKKEGKEEYSAWQRLTKRLPAMSAPDLEEDEFQNIQGKSAHSNWLKLGYVTG